MGSRSWNFMACSIVQKGMRMDNFIVCIVLGMSLSDVTAGVCHQINFNVNRLARSVHFSIYFATYARNSLNHDIVTSIRKRYTKTSTLWLKSRTLKSFLSNLLITSCQLAVTLFHSCFQLFSDFRLNLF